jgi:hypothetical protein
MKCVQCFRYVGFLLESDFSWDDHLNYILSRTGTAVVTVGAMCKRLELRDLNRARIFFSAFVSSQIYGLDQVFVEQGTFERFVSRFLSVIFSLPRSFPHQVSLLLLSLPPFSWQQLRSFCCFAKRIAAEEQENPLIHRNPARHGLLFDRSLFPNADSLWPFQLSRVLADFLDVDEFFDFCPMEDQGRVLDRVLSLNRERRVQSLSESTGLSFLLDIFPDGFATILCTASEV